MGTACGITREPSTNGYHDAVVPDSIGLTELDGEEILCHGFCRNSKAGSAARGSSAGRSRASSSSGSLRTDSSGEFLHYTHNENFQDIEYQWINSVLEELWPYTNDALHDLMKRVIEPNLNDALPNMLKGIRFKDFSLGQYPPQVTSANLVKKSKGQFPGIEVGLSLCWSCQAQIDLEVPGKLTVGIKRVSLSCDASLVLRPLLKRIPIVGGIQIFLISPPELEWEFSGVAAFTKLPIISDALHTVAMEAICKELVLPNRLFIHWAFGQEYRFDVASMRFPRPLALLRLGVLQARGVNRTWMPWAMVQEGLVYARIRVGALVHRTCAVNLSTGPSWGRGDWKDFFVYNPKQQVWIELCWEGLGVLTTDSVIGQTHQITLDDVMSNPADTWWPIRATGNVDQSGNEQVAGEVRLIGHILHFSSSAGRVRNHPEKLGSARSTALLTTKLRGLRGLPEIFASGAVMKITVEDEIYDSIPSVYTEALQDMSNVRTQIIDPVVQRLAECLAERKEPLDQISELGQIDLASLEEAVLQKPSFTARWDQAIHVLLKHPETAEVSLELIMHDSLRNPLASLTEAFSKHDVKPHECHPEVVSVKQLLLQKEMVMNQTLRFKAVSGEEVVDLGPFDLDVEFQLWGFADREDGNAMLNMDADVIVGSETQSWLQSIDMQDFVRGQETPFTPKDTLLKPPSKRTRIVQVACSIFQFSVVFAFFMGFCYYYRKTAAISLSLLAGALMCFCAGFYAGRVFKK